jgi:dTDP-4-amino-4,6-dideoxygalactose transaminase
MTIQPERHPADISAGEIPAETILRWHAAIADELREAFEACLPANRFTLGPKLQAFEKEWAAYCDSTFGIGVSSGTAALTLALRALGVGPGDEVITVPNTYIATTFAITYCGAAPVFVDVDPVTSNMDPARVANAVSSKTKAILPVHLYGLCVDTDGVRKAAPGIPILEDAAHAHGATLHGKKAGSLGDVAAFSFYPTKVMGALGDGGALTTSSPELDDHLRQLRYMGQHGVKHQHVELGYQERLDEMQAAFLSVKLRHLEGQIEGRRRVARGYDRWLKGTPVRPAAGDVTGRHVYYMYTCHAPKREALRAFLDERHIRTQLIYPTVIPDQKVYQQHPWRAADKLEVARSLEPELLCLPMFAELTDAEVDRVGQAIREFYGAD